MAHDEHDSAAISGEVVQRRDEFEIPSSIEHAAQRLDSLGELVFAAEWKRAAIVRAFVTKGEGGRRTGSKVSQLSVREFAELGIVGLKSRNTVGRYHDAWELTGLPDPKPGQTVELPTLEVEFPSTGRLPASRLARELPAGSTHKAQAGEERRPRTKAEHAAFNAAYAEHADEPFPVKDAAGLAAVAALRAVQAGPVSEPVTIATTPPAPDTAAPERAHDSEQAAPTPEPVMTAAPAGADATTEDEPARAYDNAPCPRGTDLERIRERLTAADAERDALRQEAARWRSEAATLRDQLATARAELQRRQEPQPAASPNDPPTTPEPASVTSNAPQAPVEPESASSAALDPPQPRPRRCGGERRGGGDGARR